MIVQKKEEAISKPFSLVNVTFLIRSWFNRKRAASKVFNVRKKIGAEK